MNTASFLVCRHALTPGNGSSPDLFSCFRSHPKCLFLSDKHGSLMLYISCHVRAVGTCHVLRPRFRERPHDLPSGLADVMMFSSSSFFSSSSSFFRFVLSKVLASSLKSFYFLFRQSSQCCTAHVTRQPTPSCRSSWLALFLQAYDTSLQEPYTPGLHRTPMCSLYTCVTLNSSIGFDNPPSLAVPLELSLTSLKYLQGQVHTVCLRTDIGRYSG